MRQTAGQLSLKAREDTTKYDLLEVGHALTDDIIEQLQICAERHDKIIGEDEYFLVMIVAGDPLILGIRRHKYCALMFLPQPRPQQVVFLYNRHTQQIRRLWSMPDAKVMAVIGTMTRVDKRWQQTKGWVDAFYAGKFFEYIRQETGIKHLSEREFLDLHSKEIVEFAPQQLDSVIPDAFDFSKISIDHIVNTQTALSE